MVQSDRQLEVHATHGDRDHGLVLGEPARTQERRAILIHSVSRYASIEPEAVPFDPGARRQRPTDADWRVWPGTTAWSRPLCR